MKKIMLLMSLVLIAGYAIAQNATATEGDVNKNEKFVVYYFMSTPRCMTCNKIESETKKSVLKNFKKQLDAGTLTFEVVDIGLDENKHYRNDFKLFTKSVVLVEKNNKGEVIRFKNLEKIWELIHNGDKYDSYIGNSIKKFLKIK